MITIIDKKRRYQQWQRLSYTAVLGVGIHPGQ